MSNMTAEQALAAIDDLISTASRVDGWESFPSAPLDAAEAAALWLEQTLSQRVPELPKTQADHEDYDCGAMNDYGGGNVSWWHDYIRYEIGNANDWWRQQVCAELPTQHDDSDPMPMPLFVTQEGEEIARLRERVKELDEKYSELLYQVHEKIQYQSRHDTALARLSSFNERSNGPDAACQRDGGD